MIAGDPASVLVIDDEEAVREVIIATLEEEGFVVESAPNAEEALVKVRQTPYDAIVTDLNLPGLKGTDVVREALTIYPDAIIVVITGAGSIAATLSSPTRRASSTASAPGPQPTSRTRMPACTPAASASFGASPVAYRPMKRS